MKTAANSLPSLLSDSLSPPTNVRASVVNNFDVEVHV